MFIYGKIFILDLFPWGQTAAETANSAGCQTADVVEKDDDDGDTNDDVDDTDHLG